MVFLVCREHEDGGTGARGEMLEPDPALPQGPRQAQAAQRRHLQPEERHSPF